MMLPEKSQVLVVEDDVCLDTVVTKILRSIKKDCEIVWVTSAEDAQKILENHRKERAFALIIADYRLLGHATGLGFWRVCVKQCPKTPFVLMSGYGTDKLLNLLSGFEHCPPFVAKPFYPKDFQKTLESVWEGSSQQNHGNAA